LINHIECSASNQNIMFNFSYQIMIINYDDNRQQKTKQVPSKERLNSKASEDFSLQ